MLEELRKALLIGIGGTAIAVEKSIEEIEKLVDRGRLTVAEGKKLTEELIQRKDEELTEHNREQIEALLLEMNVAQRKDIEDLETKVEDLQRKLDQKFEQ